MQLRVCCVCGKQFIPGSEHIYRLRHETRNYMCCSWICFQKAQEMKNNCTFNAFGKEKGMNNRLKELRDRSRLTIDEVSILTGISPSAICRHENGSRGLTEASIIKYANVYKVPTHQLFMEPSTESESESE